MKLSSNKLAEEEIAQLKQNTIVVKRPVHLNSCSPVFIATAAIEQSSITYSG